MRRWFGNVCCGMLGHCEGLLGFRGHMVLWVQSVEILNSVYQQVPWLVFILSWDAADVAFPEMCYGLNGLIMFNHVLFESAAALSWPFLSWVFRKWVTHQGKSIPKVCRYQQLLQHVEFFGYQENVEVHWLTILANVSLTKCRNWFKVVLHIGMVLRNSKSIAPQITDNLNHASLNVFTQTKTPHFNDSYQTLDLGHMFKPFVFLHAKFGQQSKNKRFINGTLNQSKHVPQKMRPRCLGGGFKGVDASPLLWRKDDFDSDE